MTRPTTSRRRFLFGTGSAILLPTFLSLTPRGARADEGPIKRFVTFFAPNGAVMDQWKPRGVGTSWVAGSALQPLAPVRDRVTVLSGLSHPESGAPSHAPRMRSLLTERLADREPYRFGRSIDQALVPLIAGGTLRPSIQFSCEPTAACGTPQCAWLGVASWASETEPMPAWHDPATMFEGLFGGIGSVDPAVRADQRRRGRSVLDTVLGDLSGLRSELSPADGVRLDQYLTGLREVERRLELLPSEDAACPPAPPTSNGASSLDVVHRTDVSMELVRLALACDVTRVVTFLLGGAESYRPLDFLGQSWDHHAASHFDPASHAVATTWQVERYARLLGLLDDTIQSTGRTLLDDTFVLYTSEISGGPDHGRDDIPTLLGGGGGIDWVGGSHTVLPPRTPMARLAVSLLEFYGQEGARFGLDGDAPAISQSSAS